MQIALKVDVDTLRGYQEGVPAMLKLFDKLGIRTSFFFSFGPDNSGKAIRRIFRKGFISKMLRTNAPGTYGMKTMMYGTILPAPMIVPSKPEIFKNTILAGHETGVHAWDHVDWQDCLDSMPRCKMENHFDRAMSMYRKLSGVNSRCCAAPAWKTTTASLDMQDRKKLLYASDTRGRTPFIPCIGERTFKTMQIPSTLPTMDEILGANGVTPDNVNDRYMELLRPGLNVHTIHAEMEGMSMLSSLRDLIKRCISTGATFTTLEEVAHGLKREDIPACSLVQGYLPGRAGAVSLQGHSVKKTGSDLT